MKGAVKRNVDELTHKTRQMTTDLADVKTQLQRQRTATHNATTEISKLVMLVKEQLTQAVNYSLVTVKRQVQQVSENNATKEGIKQVVRELVQMRDSLQLMVTDNILQLNEINGELKLGSTIVSLFSYFTVEAPC
jgi:succinylglutamate desuccinylase